MHMENKIDIAERITMLRKNRNWSQADLAEKINVSRVIVGKYEKQESVPSVEVAKRIADAFEVSLDYLVGDGQNAGFDKRTLQLVNEIEGLETDVKEKLLYLANAIIRDYKTQQAYAS